MPNNKLQDFFSKQFRALLSNEPSGTPPWLETIAKGETGGLFMPTDAPWIVHRDFGTLVGGIRALLMQALHPGTLAGVAQHSRYEQDALGRLAGTIRWLTVTTFGSYEAVAGEASRVNRLHDRVKGQYQDQTGNPKEYQAKDQDLLLWVHIAFTDSFLTCHQDYAWRAIPGGPDSYVVQWSKSVEPLGLLNVPHNKNELDKAITGYLNRGELRADETTLKVIKFIRTPGLPLAVMPIYRLLFAAAVASLRPEHRNLLKLKVLPRWLVKPLTRITLRSIQLLIGNDSPIEDGALARLRRLGLIAQ
ncbi:MAG: DUF2236 domain-containing protein [Micrococcales bacterium]|nr:DUF2236 domain-containing protein [Micrococcales bacterium]